MARSKKEIGTGFITQMDRYLFGEGTHYQIYDKLGAHPKNYKGKDGFYFAVWAPHAAAVSVVGDFNNWDPDADYTNSPSRHSPARYYSRAILTLSAASTVREPLPSPGIFPAFNGRTIPG